MVRFVTSFKRFIVLTFSRLVMAALTFMLSLVEIFTKNDALVSTEKLIQIRRSIPAAGEFGKPTDFGTIVFTRWN